MNTLSALSNLTDTQIIEAAQRRGEPGWLVLQREAAWKTFAEAIPPIWRRTDLSKFVSADVVAPDAPYGTTLTWDESLAAQGVIFMPMLEAAKSHNPVVQARFGTAIDAHSHKFNALHSAIWQDGAFLYVPKNVAAEAPFVANFALNSDGVSFAHNLVVLEEGASASFVEEYASPDGLGQSFANPATELFVGTGATLRYVVVQAWGRNVYHIGAQRVIAGRDASVEWVSANLGGKVQHVEAEIALTEAGSRVEWQGVTFATEKQSLLTAPILRHVGINTESHLDFKTVVADDGYSSFDGLIKIEKGSKGTATRLEEHALHLGGKGRTDSIPGLKIDTNDVARAGHASTSGEVDEEQLFYMQTRGISRADAIYMIVMGFFEPVIERIPSEDVRARVLAAIEAKM